MSHVSGLLEKYARHIGLEWLRSLAPAQRVIFLIYDPAEELKVRFAIENEFEQATQSAHHPWKLVEIEDAFSRWMAEQDYKEAYFASPEDLSEDQLGPLADYLSDAIVSGAGSFATDPKAVVAVSGAGGVFGLSSVHKIVEKAAEHIAGRLVVFFPGACNGTNFRLLDGHDGEGYLATVIQA